MQLISGENMKITKLGSRDRKAETFYSCIVYPHTEAELSSYRLRLPDKWRVYLATLWQISWGGLVEVGIFRQQYPAPQPIQRTRRRFDCPPWNRVLSL